MTTPTREVELDLGPRLRAAAQDVDDLDEEIGDARRLLRQLVVQAVDEGYSQRSIARLTGRSPSWITKVLAEPDDD
jgi:hypothetical protein